MVSFAGLGAVLVEIAARSSGHRFFAADFDAGERHDAAVHKTPEKCDFEPILALIPGERFVRVLE